jgi:hypothetical protein
MCDGLLYDWLKTISWVEEGKDTLTLVPDIYQSISLHRRQFQTK